MGLICFHFIHCFKLRYDGVVNLAICFACSTMLWEGELVMAMVSLSCVRLHFISFQSPLKFSIGILNVA